jgi:hypothetical protein
VRSWIKAPGFEDHTTRVHWTQSGRVYADVRIPLERPDLGHGTCLADLSAQALHALMQAEGFAGHVTLEDDRCTWHREINWHGTPEALDVGAISFDAEGRMIEAGVLAEYTELWETAKAPDLNALRFEGGGYTAILITSNTASVLGIGRTGKPATGPLIKALKAESQPSATKAAFDGLHALCHLDGNTLVADLATNPFVEGTSVLTLGPEGAIWHKTRFDGTRHDIELRAETVAA